jgi:hypothetical protein
MFHSGTEESPLSNNNRSLETFSWLSGHYTVVHHDKASGMVSFRFRLCKQLGNAELPKQKMVASFRGKSVEFIPERLDVARDTLGMRFNLATAELPEAWIGECEFSFGKSFRCYPDRGPSDISSSLLPERRPANAEPAVADSP